MAAVLTAQASPQLNVSNRTWDVSVYKQQLKQCYASSALPRAADVYVILSRASLSALVTHANPYIPTRYVVFPRVHYFSHFMVRLAVRTIHIQPKTATPPWNLSVPHAISLECQTAPFGRQNDVIFVWSRPWSQISFTTDSSASDRQDIIWINICGITVL